MLILRKDISCLASFSSERCSRKREAAENTWLRAIFLPLPLIPRLATQNRESLGAFTDGANSVDHRLFDLKIVSLDYILLGDYVSADKWLTLALQWDPKRCGSVVLPSDERNTTRTGSRRPFRHFKNALSCVPGTRSPATGSDFPTRASIVRRMRFRPCKKQFLAREFG